MVGTVVIALLAVTACKRSGRDSDAGFVSLDSQAANAPAPDMPSRREAASRADAAGLSGKAFNPEASPAPATIPTASSAVDSIPTSMIIRTGDASIEVDSLDSGIAAVRALAGRLGGYVANTSMQAGNDQTHAATLQLKIPSARFDEALVALEPIGKLESTNVSAEDVGEEYVDVSAQVANGRKLEQRLIELLATRTGKLSDVLQVERELARVRGEIDRQEGRLRYLRAHTAMSTLSVTVHEPVPILGKQGSGGVIAQSFRQSWRNFVGFIAGFIEALGTLVPLGVVLALVALGVVKTARRMKRPVAEGARESAS
jgi:hypothetical protein